MISESGYTQKRT